jgi:3-hydroxy acid dehydrogenase/malonic semialdehyde reductase
MQNSKLVLITGATSGFGKACAEQFAAHGHDIIITGRRKERLVEIQQELEKKYLGKVLAIQMDVRNKNEVFESVNQLVGRWQNVDVLINNAGLAAGRDFFEEASLDDWENMIDTNLKGLLYVSKAVLPLMIKRNKGHIINIGSIAGKEVYEKGNGYCATKYAVEAISKAMRIDLLRHRIKVTAIHPGAAETEFSMVRFKGNQDQAAKIYEGYTPLSAKDVADTIFYCASLPEHVCINELELTCLSQASSVYFFKNS